MLKNNSLFFSVLIFLVISLSTSCAKSQLELWVAKSDTELYRSTEGDNLILIHTIKTGVACVPNRKVVEKMFQYTEVLCEDGSYGWVVDYDNFRIIENEG